MEITSAKALISVVSSKSEEPKPEISRTVSPAVDNNRDAAASISKLSAEPKASTSSTETAVARENRASSQVKAEDVDKLTQDLAENIKSNPTKALSAISSSLTNQVVQSLLS